jgi:hypothetical protein
VWVIKDRKLRDYLRPFVTDEEIDVACRDLMSDPNDYIVLNLGSETINFQVSKDCFEYVPDDDVEQWKPYPKLKPVKNGMYLVTETSPLDGFRSVKASFYVDNLGWDGGDNRDVIAFREIPEPYQPEPNK